MATNPIGVAVLGLGGRSMHVVSNLLQCADGGARVVSAFDPAPELSSVTLEKWKPLNGGGITMAASAAEAIRAPGVSWVMVFSPNAFHKEHIVDAFAAGKHVFTEKPLATTLADCQAICDAHRAHPELQFATGFVLRYSPLYRKVKELLTGGAFGRVLSIDANENIGPAHGGYIAANWRRLVSMAGPHILEKCCHDLDLINWFCESLATRAASFGGQDFFTPDNQGLMKKYGDKTFVSWFDPLGQPDPFVSGNEMMDNQVAILQYRNGIRVQFQCTMSNALPERRMLFCCTEGTIEAELYSSRLRFRRLGDEGETHISFGVDGHGGGDDYIMKELYETMTKGVPPKCGADEGLVSAVTALAIDEAARTNQVVDLEPIWKGLGR